MTTHDDLREIEELKYRYLRAVDTKDWAGLATTLTEDVRVDYGSKVGGTPLTFDSRDAVVDYLSAALTGTIVTEHRVDHPIINIDGDQAAGSWYLQDRVIVPDADCMIIGAAFYRDRYRLTDAGWRISATGYDRTYEAVGVLSAGGWHVTPGPALG